MKGEWNRSNLLWILQMKLKILDKSELYFCRTALWRVGHRDMTVSVINRISSEPHSEIVPQNDCLVFRWCSFNNTLRSYKLQLMQRGSLMVNSCATTFGLICWIGLRGQFLAVKMVLCDEATFCVSGEVSPNFILQKHVMFFNMSMTTQNAYIFYQLIKGFTYLLS